MWDGLAAFGFAGGQVFEPGCGKLTFSRMAPQGTSITGIEKDPLTAAVAAALHPQAQVLCGDFAETQWPEGSFDAAIGNVPFGAMHLADPDYNPNPARRDPIHTHFIRKSAGLVRPGGLIALITSRWTMDGAGDDAVAARRDLARTAELLAAVRLPGTAHRRTAGTTVVTDVLVFRRLGDGEQPPQEEPAWVQTAPVTVDGQQTEINRHFAVNPAMILGELALGGARRGDDLQVTAPPGTDLAPALAAALTRAAAARPPAAPAGDPAPATTADPAPVPFPHLPARGLDQPPEGYQRACPDGSFERIVSHFYEKFDPPGKPADHEELRALLGLRDTALSLLDAELASSEDAGPVDALRAELNARYDAYAAAYGPVNRYTPQIRLRTTPEGRALREEMLADGRAELTGGTFEVTDPAARAELITHGYAEADGDTGLKHKQTKKARAARHRMIGDGRARLAGQSTRITDTGKAWVLANIAELDDAVLIIRDRPGQGGFRSDPFAARVQALEKFDPETRTAAKRDIMRHRVLLPRPVVDRASDPADALAISMDRHGEVRLDEIASLLGAAGPDQARALLGGLVFHDPADDRLVPAPLYLSGPVREKLRQAEAAAEADPDYQANVEALKTVIPRDKGPAEIHARLGAVFITPDEVRQFLAETLTDDSVTVRFAAGKWEVTGAKHSSAATIIWGTADRDALSLAENALNRGSPVEITRSRADGTTYVDQEATMAARAKQAELSDRFAGWVWEDLERAAGVCRRYNDTFNGRVLRSYDDARLSLPGVNKDIDLYWWQKSAIARMIYEPTALLGHDMGLGKTLEQIIGVMEQKRLGLIRKPVFVVKNHLLEQFADEFLWAYPQAQVMCADSPDLAGDGRRQFVARAAAENPDAIIMTQRGFETIPLTPAGHQAYLDYMEDMYQVHAESETDSVKDQETMLEEFSQRLRAYFDPEYAKGEDEEEKTAAEGGKRKAKKRVEQDPAMCWEHIGADYIVTDESQDYGNLWVPSSEPGMGIGFTHRAIDMHMKLQAVRARHGSRVGTFASGTAVTNKIAQIYNLMVYLIPEQLQDAGFVGFAPWAATFTEAEQRLEMKADGGFGLVTRHRLINVQELLLMLHGFCDFKDAGDVGIPRPAIRGGKPEIKGIPGPPELYDWQATLPERYHEARKGRKKEKGDDTVVAVLGDGFRAGQDLRLVHPSHGAHPDPPSEPQKIDYIADDIIAEWRVQRQEYPGEDGQPDPVRGSLQLVFSNEGVPKAGQWSLYEELRSLLVARGMPRSKIRFIHEAGNDAGKKQELFAACNAGHVAVLIASTEKGGVGVNVQRRCIGVHHVHPHWRPDFTLQEDARARRRGNLNPEVFIKHWITEGSFDTTRTQTSERKAVFLRVIKHRDPTVLTVDVPGDDQVTFAAMTAIAAREPRLFQKAELESKVQQLAQAQRRHFNEQNALKVARQQARALLAAAGQGIRDIDEAAPRVTDTSGDNFAMTVDGRRHSARREAGDHMLSFLQATRRRLPGGSDTPVPAGRLGGFPLAVTLAPDRLKDDITLILQGLPGGELRLDHREMPAAVGLVTRLENRLGGLAKLRRDHEETIARQTKEAERAQAALGAPFPHEEALAAARAALDALVEELRTDNNSQEGTADQPAAPPDTAGAIAAAEAATAALSQSAASGEPGLPASRVPAAGLVPAVGGYQSARVNALEALGVGQGEPVPDAEQFADYFARKYGRKDPQQWPLVMQAYIDEWLPGQPEGHPLKQQRPSPHLPALPGLPAVTLLPQSGAPAAHASPEPGAGSAGAAGGAAPAHGAPRKSGAGQAGGAHPGSPGGAEEPGPGMTPEELDFVHQNAFEYALFGISRPSPDQEERALDYAAWYMAEFGDGESMDDLPGHDHALRWFADRGYPAREYANATRGHRDQGQPGAEPTGPPGRADPEPPADPWGAAGLCQLAEACGLAAATDRAGGTLTVTVHDQGRTVLVHDDLTGATMAGGRRLDPAQVVAYLAAYARHPQLPPRCLLGLARHDLTEPAPLTLTAARGLAARYGLEVRVRRAGGRSYINFCEPSAFHGFGGNRYTPVLSYLAGADSAYHGPCAVPVAAIDSYLGAYRTSVPAATFAALEPMDCGYRAVPLTPHLIDGSGLFIPAVRDRWRAAIAAARDRDAAEVFRLLDEAEGLTPVSLTPEREAELTAAIRRHAARYGTAEDLAARLSSGVLRDLDVTWREQGWVRDCIAAHPEVRERAEDGPEATPDSDREAAAGLAAQAKEALASGEHERALALIDETELLRPELAATGGYDRARDQVRTAMRQASPEPEHHAGAAAAQGPADQASGAEEPGTTDIPAEMRDANGGGEDCDHAGIECELDGCTCRCGGCGAGDEDIEGTGDPDVGADDLTGVTSRRNGQGAEARSGQAPSAAPDAPGVPRVTVLHGHTSPETAYLVGDYPYGRRLRCEKRYWLEVAAKGQYRGQVRLVTQTTNPKRPGRQWNKPHPEQYRAWSVMYLNQDGHVKLRSVSDWGPWGRDDAEIRLDGIYGQLDGEERAAYDKLVELGRRGRNWDSWYDALGFIRGYQAEHGALPDAGQVQAAPGFYTDEATSRTAVAAVAAGLGGVHAGPGAPASPAAGTPAAAPSARDGERADTTRPGSPAVPEDPGDGEPAPGQGFDWGGADFRYELAYAFALGSNRPGSAEDERARDFAAWYMARHGGEKPGGEIPAHSFEWRRFAELGYPARAPRAEQAEAGPAAPAGEPVAADSTSTEESAEAPAAAPPEPAAADRDADGLGHPGSSAAQETASPGEGQEAPDASGMKAPATPAAAPGPARQDEHPAAGPGRPVGEDSRRAERLLPVLDTFDRLAGLGSAVDAASYQASAAKAVTVLGKIQAGAAWPMPPAAAVLTTTDPGPAPAAWRAAVSETRRDLETILAGHGYEFFGAAGEIADPDTHLIGESPQYDPEQPDDTVLSVVQRGVRRQGRLLRPAAVITSTRQKPPAGPPVPAAGPAETITSGEPGLAGSAGAASEPAPPPGPDETDAPGRYSARIRVSSESPPVVSGTDYNNDPPELREALRANGFEWQKPRQVWEYKGRRRDSPGPVEAAGAIRALVSRLDRESPAPAAKDFPPTPQQQAILDAFGDGKSIAVQALAGTGKTTTLVLLARALLNRSPDARIVYTAFNSAIVDEARRGRFPRNVTPSTMHSLARQALLQTGYAAKIERGQKGARWPEQWAEVLGISAIPAAAPGDAPVSADAVARLVIATAKKFRESADDEPGPQHLDVAAGSSLGKAVLSYARAAWADISDPGNAKALADGRALRVDHDDYLKVWALSRPRINASVIFFDEAQDVNQLMKAVILDQPAQTVVVGDSQQSIYGFRGAIDALKDWPADITLPLTQSWRFGPEAAEFGNLFLRSLGSKLLLEGNPARGTRLGSTAEPDAVLCRTNATAVAEVFAGLESGKRTALAGGGDAIAEIAKAARDLQAGKGTKHPDLSRFTTWDEVRQYARDEEDGQALQVFVRLVDRHGPGGLIDMIGRLTPEDDTKNPPQLTISTLHKAKGREWKAVRIAGDFRGPVTDPETGEVTWPSAEERRISYVAATRAMELLEPGSLSWIKDYPLPASPGAQRPARGQDRQAQAAAPDAPPHLDAQPEPAAPAGQEQEPAPQDSPQAAPAMPEHTAPAGPGQDSAGAGLGNAHPDLRPSAAEPDPGEDCAAPAAEPDGDRRPAAGEPAGARAPGTDDGADPGEQPAAARSDPGTVSAASLDAAGTAPEADAHAVLHALAEQHGMAVTAEQVSPTITVTTVTDSGRFVLRHDDFLGAAAEGTRIGLDEAEAYLGAWRAYPGLPALALLDWVRHGPEDPAQLSLSAARAVAADYGLVAEPVRAAGQPFIVVRHPGLSGTVLACRPGDPAASAGPVTVPVPSVGTYLRLYQAAVRPHWLTALGKRSEWANQLTAMMPYLINGTSLYSAEAHRHVDAAANAAGMDDERAVKDLLRRAWAAAGPFSPSLDREAVLLRVIGDVAPRYQEITGDGPRYAAETAHASDPEWDWIYQYVRENPDILTAPTPTRDALEQRDAGERAQAEAEGNDLSAAAKAAFDAGDYPAALDLADQGETADPGRARRWEQIRGAIREKAAAAGQAPQTSIPERPAPTVPGADEPPQQQAAAPAAEPAAAAASASTDAGPGADDGARPGELSPLAVPAGHDESVRFLEELAARYGLRVSHVTDTLKWWTVHLSALDGGAGVPVAEYEGHTGKWSGFGTGRLDSGEVAAYLAAHGESDLHDAPAGPSDPYTRIGPARYDYHKALLAYQALRETKADRSLMETQDTDKPRPDAIALNAAYQAVSGGWKKAFAGEAEEVTGRFAAWEHTARVMAGNLAATRHRAGKFRAALDVFTESAGHLASRTRATAEDPGAWARVSGGLARRTQAAGPAPGETTAPGDAPPAASPATAPSGPAPADETSPQPGRDDPAGDSPAAAPASKAPGPRSYRLTRQWPDGTVRESSTPFTSLRAAAQAVAYTLADNGAASRKDAAAFASRLQDAAPGATMTHPSGYSFTIRLVAAVAPLRNMDLAAELDRMPGTVFARWLSMGATPPATGDLDYQRPGAGSWATVSADGIELTVNEPDVTRHGLLSWPQVASWIDKGVTPARLGIVTTASRLRAYVGQHADQLAAAGTCDPGAVAAELDQIRATTIAAIVDAARRSRGTAVPVPPVPPGDPAWHTAVPVTRPGSGPGKAENRALERLLALRTLAREPQPLTPQEIRDTIRRAITLADVARAMSDPAAMRAWISDQARRTPSGSYDGSGRNWHGHGPGGLTINCHGDDRAPHVIAWDAILAWVEPGLTGALREELLAADDASDALMHREIGVTNPGTVADPSAEEKERAGQRLRAAADAAWAAIQAAPPPSPADFNRTRYAARDTSPVQDSLFADLPPDRAPADAARPELPPAADPGSPAASPAQPEEPAPGTGAQAAAPQPEPERQPPAVEDGSSLLDPDGNFIRLSDENPLARHELPAARSSHRMDEYDIEQAVERWRDHPLLGPASRTLAALAAWADDGKDGWMTWPLPMNAAQRLMELIERDGRRRYQADRVRADVTVEELKKAYTPIKGLRTKMAADFEIEEPAAPTRPRRQRQDDAAEDRPRVNETPAGPSHEAPARDSEAEPPTEPVSNTDLVIAMRHVQGGFLRLLTEGRTPDGGGSRSWRSDDEPDARASQDIDYGPRGVEITLRGRGFRRHGRLSWAQITSWIDAGVTPARLGIILTADRLSSAGAARGGLAVTGTGDFDAVMAELDRIREDGLNAVIDAALRAHGADAPVPPTRRGGPAFYVTPIAAGPVESASDAENAALERLNQLRPVVYNPQPLTPQETRATIRRWIGDGLPAYAAALGNPAKMRAWVAAQVRGPARRSAGITYSTPTKPGGRWYGGWPEGLLTATDVELRARLWNLIPWEDIPAWVQPGLTDSLRARLLAATPGKGNDEDSLRGALDAAWAAIEAAPPPSAADFDAARRAHHGASPAQLTLLGNPPPDSANTRKPATASLPREEAPSTTADGAQSQSDAPDQAVGSPQSGTNPPGQAPEDIGENDTQAPPAAASQEPPQTGHGDSLPGDSGPAAAPPEPPAREPGPATGLPPTAGNPPPGSEADRNPGAAQDTASGETATADTAGAAQEHGIGAAPAVTHNDPADQPEHEDAETERPETTRERSRELRDEATIAYRAGRYAKARELAKRAQLLDPDGAQYGTFQDRVTAAADAAHDASGEEPAGYPVAPTGSQAPGPQPEARLGEPPGMTADSPSARPDRPDRPAEPAAVPQFASGPDPLTSDDIFLGVSRLPAFVIGDLFTAINNGRPAGSVSRQLPSFSGERAAGEPDPGARETVAAMQAGLRIEVAGPDGRRVGLVTWAQVDSLLRPGTTPARRQIVTRASATCVNFMAASASFRAIGESDLAAVAEGELRRHAEAALTAILAAVRPGVGSSSLPAADDAVVERIAALADALPARSRGRIAAAQVKQGHIIGHPGHRFAPFRVTEPPRQAGTVVEITGNLTDPAGTGPAGPVVLTVPSTGRAGHVITIPAPARSLRPLFSGLEAAAGADQPTPAWPDRDGESAADKAEEQASQGPVHGASPPASRSPEPDAPSQEETMLPATDLSAPQQPTAPAEPDPAPQPQASYVPPDQAALEGGMTSLAERDGTTLVEEMARVLEAIAERKGTAGGDSEFADIRAAFAAMRDALGLPAAGPAAERGPASGTGASADATPPPRGEPAPADGFTDIWDTFTDLRDILGLPRGGEQPGPDEQPSPAAAAVADALDRAAAEAQACARWYRDAPEWQRARTVGRAVRDLVNAIREAAGDYWAEIRQDVRVRGFARTLAARTSLAVAGTAHLLAGGLERAGLGGSPPWRAAWRLHQATSTLASRIMRYTPPGDPGRVAETRRIIDDLGQRQNRPGQPGPGRPPAPGSNGTRTPNAAAAASSSFPVTVNRSNIRQAAAPPAGRPAAATSRQPTARRRH